MTRCDGKYHPDPIIPSSNFVSVSPDMHQVYRFRDVYRYLLRVEQNHEKRGEWKEAHYASRLRAALRTWAVGHFGIILD